MVRTPCLFLSVLLTALALASTPEHASAQQPAAGKLPAWLTAKPVQLNDKDDELQRLLKERYNAALVELQTYYEAVERNTRVLDHGLIDAARQVLESALELSDKPADLVAARENYLEVVREYERRQQQGLKGTRVPSEVLAHARYLRLDAEVQLLKAKRQAKSESK